MQICTAVKKVQSMYTDIWLHQVMLVYLVVYGSVYGGEKKKKEKVTASCLES